MTLTLRGVRLPLAHFVLDVTATLTARITGIFGPSGAGKTTLLELIAGVRRPRGGEIALDGETLDDAATHVAARHRRLGYVPQENALFPHMTVAQNIAFAARGADLRHVADVLEIAHLLDRGVGALSGGEQKRVALARAIVTAPRLLLLDEPLAGLDRPLHGRITEYLERIRDDFGVPMLYVTHDRAEMARIAEEIVVLEEGRVVAQGATAEVVSL